MIWERQPDEPANWYARFDTFRLLGPRRTLEQAFRRTASEAKFTGPQRGPRPGTAWYTAAARWHWKQRAEAWDESLRQELRELAATRRFDAQEQRLQMITTLLDSVFTALAACDIAAIPPGLALANLPVLRLFFKELLEAQRRELGYDDSPGDRSVTFTADDLLQAAKLLKEFESQHAT